MRESFDSKLDFEKFYSELDFESLDFRDIDVKSLTRGEQIYRQPHLGRTASTQLESFDTQRQSNTALLH